MTYSNKPQIVSLIENIGAIIEKCRFYYYEIKSQPAITCSKLTIEPLEQGVKYTQSSQ